MQRCKAAAGAESARSVLVHIILLFCIGWTLNWGANGVVGAPVIERHDDAEDDCNDNQLGNEPDLPRSANIKKPIETEAEGMITPASLTANLDNHVGDKFETDRNENVETLPEILLPDNILKAMHHDSKNNSLARDEWEIDDVESSGEDHRVFVVMEYQPNLVLRCAAKGNPKPNVTWEFEGGHFPHYVTSNSMTHGHGYSTLDPEDEDKRTVIVNVKVKKEDEAWVDLKLPKLNNAFYGTIRCKAENGHGNATWEVKLVHNANSSALMKVVRCAVAVVLIMAAVLVVKGIVWADKKRHDKLYERLPPQDYEIINKFKKGLEPPPPSPCSSILVEESTAKILLDGATSCVKGIEITVSGEEGDIMKAGNMKGGYRPVKQVSSSPDFQKREGSSTPSTCSSGHILDSVNSWTNYVPYDDKMETSSRHFKVDYSKILTNGCYGRMYGGKIRNDLTLEWSTVAVKSGGTGDDDENSFALEYILTELKILASLPRVHDNIMNLRGAYTKMLHKRRALVFLDACEHGTLASFIDLNRGNFQGVLIRSEEPSATKDSAPSIQESNKSSNDGIAARDENTENTNVDVKAGELQKTITLKNLFVWVWQIADGMFFLHKNRVTHGNLTTANVFMSSNLKVKIGNIGYPQTMHDTTDSMGESSSKMWLTTPHYSYEPNSKRSDIWDYGRVIWEIFSLRKQKCPDNQRILEHMHAENDTDEEEIEVDELDVPQYATAEIFEVMLCCWNENATLCPDFDFFVKTFKKLYRDALIKADSALDISENSQQQKRNEH